MIFETLVNLPFFTMTNAVVLSENVSLTCDVDLKSVYGFSRRNN